MFGIDASWDPLVRIDNNGELSDIEVEMLRLLNRKLGANIQLKTGVWAEMVAQAKAREIDGLAGSVETAERRQHLCPLPIISSTTGDEPQPNSFRKRFSKKVSP